ncbi:MULTISPECIES: HTTM domain-containing protein [Streptomyces]|uniref:HTTM domain-containing protein n=1 Tax=Streptomyces heilongjiangensis TaxID=945052 RepID=A0ABW1BEB8_9ACTN|nr:MULTISPECIES: HTTM domain-containing protein [Streptomyces]MDC2946113.1 HTTM domain-containing protein [Streptomyces heilongjiangensis]
MSPTTPVGPTGPTGPAGTTSLTQPADLAPGNPPAGGGGPLARLTAAVGSGIARVTDNALGPYQSAIVRIGFAGTWLLFLLREFPHRRELYGPDGPWSWDLAQELIANNGAFTTLMWSDGMVWFEIVYAVAVLSSLMLLLGWRTRTASVLFMVGVLSLQNRSVFMGDGGDNVIHLMAIYLVFLRCGQVWSLDARRERRTRERPAREGLGAAAGPERPDAAHADRVGPLLWCALGFVLLVATFGGLVPGGFAGGWLTIFWGLWVVHGAWWAVHRIESDVRPRVLLDIVANLAHNAALVVIMAEACLIYATAGWYKIQGSRWQDGTAVYYPLHLDYFSPWPALSDLMTSSGTMVMLVTYGTVIAQVAFPFTLFNRRVKNVLLAVMMTEHAAIALVLGLPFFSLAMIAADAVFLPTSFLKRLGGWAARARDGVVRRVPLGRGRGGSEGSGQGAPPPEKETAEQAHVGFTA